MTSLAFVDKDWANLLLKEVRLLSRRNLSEDALKTNQHRDRDANSRTKRHVPYAVYKVCRARMRQISRAAMNQTFDLTR